MTAPESATSARNMTAAARRDEALQLRKGGLNYRQIAARLGVSYQAVGKMLKKELELLAASSHMQAAEYRELELSRLDQMLVAIWGDVLKGDEQKIDRALKIIAQRSKLLGLDAPVKVAPTDPSGEHEWTGKSDTELLAEFNAILETARARAAGVVGDGD